jgi:hypothetical protein
MQRVISRRRAVGVIAIAIVVATAGLASAALTSEGCLARKRRAWGGLYGCNAAVQAMRLRGGHPDALVCVHRFNAKLKRIDSAASSQHVACRYRDNGDGTVTDYDTGLQWEKKTTSVGSGENVADPHDVDNRYRFTAQTGGIVPDGSAFTAFLAALNDCSLSSIEDGEFGRFGFAGACDWRLPRLAELRSIVDPTRCAGDGACIDPIFGPNGADVYWGFDAESENAAQVWNVSFGSGGVTIRSKNDLYAVRAVRSANFW